MARVAEIFELCKLVMRAAGVDQWDEFYPTTVNAAADFAGGGLFVARAEGICAGAVCLNELQAAEYAELSWRDADGRFLVVHRLCVDPDWQGRGVAAALMDFAEAMAVEQGYSSIRLDTYVGNPKALALYEGRGYHRTGQVRFPRRRFVFDCFEKQMTSASGARGQQR